MPEASAAERAAESAHARKLAERYRLEFVDLAQFSIDHELFRAIPADLMLRYGFVPYRREGSSLVIVVSDPTDLPMIDELAVLLATPIKIRVGTPSSIQAILKKSESSQRVLEEAVDGFQLQVLKDEDLGEDLTVERLTTGDMNPIIRLVDSTIYTAIQRRASDIHIETADDAVHVKYRIDGVLQPAMRPIAKQFHSSIISRIKVMAELDIAEKRVPQDGRVSLSIEGHAIDLRVVSLPSVNGEGIVMRILDKEQALISMDQLGMAPETFEPFHQPDYKEEKGWVDIKVPGNWETRGLPEFDGVVWFTRTFDWAQAIEFSHLLAGGVAVPRAGEGPVLFETQGVAPAATTEVEHRRTAPHVVVDPHRPREGDVEAIDRVEVTRIENATGEETIAIKLRDVARSRCL